jgi:hypothetical protein
MPPFVEIFSLSRNVPQKINYFNPIGSAELALEGVAFPHYVLKPNLVTNWANFTLTLSSAYPVLASSIAFLILSVRIFLGTRSGAPNDPVSNEYKIHCDPETPRWKGWTVNSITAVPLCLIFVGESHVNPVPKTTKRSLSTSECCQPGYPVPLKFRRRFSHFLACALRLDA